ncbi:MAG: DUF5107 domain-containing protein, partial [Erysipelotrichaceae bacterium]|nr:DUF5107 domain-containing protein [Erysipelotrichaceae bacterium]
MNKSKIYVEKMVIPTYTESPREEMPVFPENRNHQGMFGRPYPNKIITFAQRDERVDKEYTVVRLENDYIEVIVLPEIGGRVFGAKDKKTGYEFLYRQHVIKPALIGDYGSWISGGVEFNWPFHHRPSGFAPVDFMTEEEPDGTVVCWLSEHEPVDRTKGLVGIALSPDHAYFETRVRLTNRTPMRHPFLWWANGAVHINENYQFFFPHDVTNVYYHDKVSRSGFPNAEGYTINSLDCTNNPVDISWLKNIPDANSFFACASEYDFFGGYDHGKKAGVVHVANHHVSPGKKMFTWGNNQLSKSWEDILTDKDGPYCELMAGSYTDDQPDFSWLEPYETKEFKEYWYPIEEINVPDYANLDCAVHFGEKTLNLISTTDLGKVKVVCSCGGKEFLNKEVTLKTLEPVEVKWKKPEGYITIVITDESGKVVLEYEDLKPDTLKIPPLRTRIGSAYDIDSADELYLAGVHVEQYRFNTQQPDVFWEEALKRNPNHANSLIALGRYHYMMMNFEKAKAYLEKAIKVLTKHNTHPESGNVYYLYATVLEALGDYKKAYDFYYKAAWSDDSVAKAAGKLGALDLRNGDLKAAYEHAEWALTHQSGHYLAPAIKMIACPKKAKAIAEETLKKDPLNQLVRFLAGKKDFYEVLFSEPSQTVLDLVFDLTLMGQDDKAIDLMKGLIKNRPEQKTQMICFTLAYLLHKHNRPYRSYLKDGEIAPIGLMFAFRKEEVEVLKFAITNGSKKASMQLGSLLYDRRHYEEAASYFEKHIKADPKDYLGYFGLAVADFSHFNKTEEALKLMKKAMTLSDSEQLLSEMVNLMDKAGVDANEKVALLESRRKKMRRGDLFTELAKAYNQLDKNDKAIDALNSSNALPPEGGERGITDQWMYAYTAKALRLMKKGKYEEALEQLDIGSKVPLRLHTGVWNRYVLIPINYYQAVCLDKLGKNKEARKYYDLVLDTKHDSTEMTSLPELPYYQAMSARAIGNNGLAKRLMNDYKRKWTEELHRVDSGFFAATPYYVSFVEQPEKARRSQYLYMLG